MAAIAFDLGVCFHRDFAADRFLKVAGPIELALKAWRRNLQRERTLEGILLVDEPADAP